MALLLIINGKSQDLPTLESPASLDAVLARLGLAGDRIAVERNGEIAARGRWAVIEVIDGDRLEIVHFVGGGLGA